MGFVKTNRAEDFEPVKVCSTCKKIVLKCACAKK